MKFTSIALAALAVFTTASHAAPAMDVREWTAQACDYWNKEPILMDGLGDKWIKNNSNRGYKIIHLYRTDCGEATQTEMKIVPRTARPCAPMAVRCRIRKWTMRPTTPWHATTERWNEMGAGETAR